MNAYNRTGFTNWYQGPHAASASDPIGETVQETLGKPEGSGAAVSYFRDACEKVLTHVSEADAAGAPSYSYIYTAHPDKHMHALGVEHDEV